MAINLKFDLMDNPEPPSIVLANRNGNKLGQLNVNVESIDGKDSMKTSEITFTLNKYIDGELTPLWDKVVDFKLVYCPEWDLWYGIKVELDEATETVKTVFCTQLGQEELSQIMVYNVEINTEDDIARDDYKISILYDEDNKDASTFHRVMSKAPHYSIAHIDESLKRIQRSFSFDDASICDVFDEIEEEVGCLVVYNSNSDKDGMPKRDISIYDLYQYCDDCGYREEFIGDECPKCHSKNIIDGYGEDTTIFVTADELATEGIQLVTDTDSVKNCFKLEAGDDLMTATIRNCNPNGSDYIWYFSDAVKEDMSKELVEAIENYDSEYKKYYDAHPSNLDASLVSKYNALVEKYKEYYNTPSTCINCDYKGEFENECPSCHSGNILTGKTLQAIDTPITGYPALMNAYYNTIDLALYLESGLMPNVEMSDTKADEQVKLLTTSSLSPVAVNVEKIDSVSLATANSAVLSMAKVIVRPTYKVEISSSTLSDDKIWSGQFIVTNYSDETDTATSNTVNVTINNEAEDFIKQKIKKALNKENTDDLSISGLFDEDKYDYNAFCAELKKYALNPLKSFYDACDACLSILAEQGAGDKNEKLDLYKNLYAPYYKRSQAIAKEIKLREDEIAVIKGVYDETDETNKVLIAKGLQTDIEDCRKEIQNALNFEEYLGDNLWLELCAYRREDKYSNSNYVSDGLNNAELFEKALEFVEVAENEIFKSAELQHSISAALNNLLAIPKFKPLIKYFKTGNWIRVRVDDRIFKLRLLEYEFSYKDLKTIPVEFSDVTKIKNGTTDVQDVFSQAASMASSYDSVQRQAKKGDVARSTIDQWIVDGLNSADVQIKNNNSEEVLITKNGLLARSYSDITGTYSPEQLKITHNIMAYTDDNWETVRQAIGKHKYNLYDKDENKFVDEIGYGMNADFVVAGVVSGSQIIGGDIYSDNYSVTDATGSYLNLRDGTFSFGGGSLRYENGKLIISSKAADTNITEINEEWLKTTSVYAENLQVNSAKIQGKLTASQIDVSDLNADDIIGTTITGKTIKSSDFIGGYLLIGDEDKINDYAEIANDGTLTCTNVDIRGGVFKIGSEYDDDGNPIAHTWISEDGVLTTYDANIQGTLRSPIIIGGTINGSSLNVGQILDDEGNHTGGYYTTISSDGYLKSVEGEFKDCTITGGTLKMGSYDDGYSAWISSEDGVLHAYGAYLEDVKAASGTIGGWEITKNALYKNAYGMSSGMCSITSDFSDGLEYELSADGTYYKVIGIGTCTDIDIIIPSQYNGNPVKTIGDGAFKSCNKLMSVIIPDSVVSIGRYAFFECSSLTSVVIPDSITSIERHTFFGCGSLTSVIIPDGVTSIGMYAFSDCGNLTSITIPNSVTIIWDYAFQDCNSLTSIYYTGTEEEWNKITIYTSGNEILKTASLYYNSEIQSNNEIQSKCVSLVNSAITSQPRFFAGSNSDIPKSINDANFLVLEDGSLYATAAKISGTGMFNGEINADTGTIGGLKIDNGIKGYVDDVDTFSLTSNGLVIPSTKAKITVGNINIKASQTNKTVIQTDGSLDIVCENNNTSISLMEDKDVANNTTEFTISLNVKTKTNTQMYPEVEVYLSTPTPLYHSKTYTFYYQTTEWGTAYGKKVHMETLTLAGAANEGERKTLKCTSSPDGILNNFIRFGWTEEECLSGEYEYLMQNVDSVVFTITTEQTQSNSNIRFRGNLLPIDDAAEDGSAGYDIGGSGAYWNTIWARSSTITLSDRDKKNTIQPLSNAYTQIFDYLKPVSYKFNVNNNNRTHLGLIAQDVKEAVESAGLTTQDFAGYCEWTSDDGIISCGLRYSEFIALCVNEIQKLKKRVAELENK